MPGTLFDMIDKLGYNYKRVFLNECGIIYTTAHNTIQFTYSLTKHEVNASQDRHQDWCHINGGLVK